MNLRELVVKNRSYRRFDESIRIQREILVELVDLARLSGSAANRQYLRYLISSERAMNAKIFPALTWAGYLTEWSGPAAGERPSAYILLMMDTRVTRTTWCDHGIAAQSILLGAVEKGFGGCMIGAFNKEILQSELEIPGHLEILLIVALGKVGEKVVLEKVGQDGEIRYWRDKRGVHHVPKRSIEDIIFDPEDQDG